MKIDEDRSFPRGGSQPATFAIKNSEFHLFMTDRKSKTSKKSKRSQGKKPFSSVPEPVGLEYAGHLSYKAIVEGMKVLAVVKSVHKYHLIVDLPNHLRGRVPMTGISESYTRALEAVAQDGRIRCLELEDMFTPGQPVSARVVSVEGSNVELTLGPESLMPAQLIQGRALVAAVRSVEERVYVMDVGVTGARAVLPHSLAQEYEKAWHHGRALGVGQVVRCRITRVAVDGSTRTVELTAEPRKAWSRPEAALHWESLLPGSLVSAVVTKVLYNGIEVEVGDDHLSGTVNARQLAGREPSTFVPGEKVLGRVLVVVPTLQLLQMSLASSLCPVQPLPDPYKALPRGTRLKDCPVLTSDELGAVVRLKAGQRGFLSARVGWCPGSKTVDCVVVGYDQFQQEYIVMSFSSETKPKPLVSADLTPGQKVMVVCEDFTPYGLRVAIKRTGGSRGPLRATVNPMHLSDVPLSQPHMSFVNGEQKNARILYVRGFYIGATLKPSLVSSDLPPLSVATEALQGQMYTGTVVALLGRGALVTFYQDVRGILKNCNLPSGEQLQVGQTVHVYVHRVTDRGLELRWTKPAGTEVKEEIMSEDGQMSSLGSSVEHLPLGPPQLPSPPQEEEVAVKAEPLDWDDQAWIDPVFPSDESSIEVCGVRPPLSSGFVDTTVSLVDEDGESKSDFLEHDSEAPWYKNPVIQQQEAVTSAEGKTGKKRKLVDEASGSDVPHKQKKKKKKKNNTLAGESGVNGGGVGHSTDSEVNDDGPARKKKVKPVVSSTPISSSNGVPNKTKQLGSKRLNSKNQKTDQEYTLGKALNTDISQNSSPTNNASKKKSKVKEQKGVVSEVSAELKESLIQKLMIEAKNELSVNSDPTPSRKMNSRNKKQQTGDSQIVKQIADVPSPKKMKTKLNKISHLTNGTGKKSKSKKHIAEAYNLSKEEYEVKEIIPVTKEKANTVSGVADDVKSQNKQHLKLESEDENSKHHAKKKKKDGQNVLNDTTINNSKSKKRSISDASGGSLAASVEKGVDTTERPHLAVDAGFAWDATPDLLSSVVAAPVTLDSSSDDEEEEEQPSKESVKKQRKRMRSFERREYFRREEERLREVEQRLADSERPPQSADDFDRLVAASPNSSLCWVRYMAHHLQAAEFDRARAVGRRALTTISFREEQERLNVWMALLNLENLYGTEDSLDSTLKEALQACDALKVNLRMLEVYASSNKPQEAEKLVGLITKKFRDNRDAWLKSAETLMALDLKERARALLPRALNALDRKLHVEMISRFAHMEQQAGDSERAQTLMEQILTSYPRRVDVWNSYVDMLVKQGCHDLARQVLERAVVQKLGSHKMRALFKKFLAFEQQHGTMEGVAKVKQMAADYVESVTRPAEGEPVRAEAKEEQ